MKTKKPIPLLVLVAFFVFAVSGCGCESGPSPTPTSAPSAPTPVPPEPTSVSPMPTISPIRTPASPIPAPMLVMEISSTAFDPGGKIPEQHSCFGDNLSPPLEWSGVPEGAQSLLLFVYDPDAGAESGATVPQGFVHWVVYNIPPTTTGYPEGMPGGATLADGALQGSNDFAPYGGGTFPGGAAINLVGYDGPCPGGEHRYVFTLYALDALLNLPAEAAPAQVLEAMEGHVLTQAEVMGLYAPPE